MDISDMLVLMGFVGACFLAAATGAVFPPGDWYERLAKPSWRPPNWLFGPAWAVLYLTIAVSGWLVWRTAGLAGAALAPGDVVAAGGGAVATGLVTGRRPAARHTGAATAIGRGVAAAS